MKDVWIVATVDSSHIILINSIQLAHVLHERMIIHLVPYMFVQHNALVQITSIMCYNKWPYVSSHCREVYLPSDYLLHISKSSQHVWLPIKNSDSPILEIYLADLVWHWFQLLL